MDSQQHGRNALWRGAVGRAAGAGTGMLLLMAPFLAIAWPIMTKPDVVLILYACIYTLAASLMAAAAPAHSAGYHEGGDRLKVAVAVALHFMTLVVAALDIAMLHVTVIQSPWLRWSGLAGFSIGLALRWWAVKSNPFFTPWVTVQTSRGHHVVEAGPYAWVRHPGYLASSIVMTAYPLMLGSWLAAVPAAGLLCLFILRTRFEDEFLFEQLSGYRAYAGRVRYRLLPGIY